MQFGKTDSRQIDHITHFCLCIRQIQFDRTNYKQTDLITRFCLRIWQIWFGRIYSSQIDLITRFCLCIWLMQFGKANSIFRQIDRPYHSFLFMYLADVVKQDSLIVLRSEHSYGNNELTISNSGLVRCFEVRAIKQ